MAIANEQIFSASKMWLNTYMTICRFTGLAPIRFEDNVMKPSTFLRCCYVLLAFINIAVTLYTVQPLQSGNLMLQLAYFMASFTGYLTAWSVLINPSVRIREFCDLYNGINNVSNDMKLLGCVVHDKLVQKQTILLLISHSTTNLTIPMTLEVFFPLWSGDMLDLFFFYQMNTFFNIMFLSQFSNVILILRDRLRAINEELEKMAENNVDGRRPAKIWPNNEVRDLFFLSKSLPANKTATSPVSPDIQHSERVCQLQTCHLKLTKLAKDFLGLHSCTILFLILHSSLETTANIYRTVRGIFILNEDYILNTVSLVKWTVVRLIEMLTVLIGCSLIGSEVSNTGYKVHQLHNAAGHNKALKKQLESFSLQLLHQNTKFSPCGLLTLDMPLLLGMAGTCITYIAIIIEY